MHRWYCYYAFFSDQSNKRFINFTNTPKESTFGFIDVLYCFCFLFHQFPLWSLLFPFSFLLWLSFFFSYLLKAEAEATDLKSYFPSNIVVYCCKFPFKYCFSGNPQILYGIFHFYAVQNTTKYLEIFQICYWFLN